MVFWGYTEFLSWQDQMNAACYPATPCIKGYMAPRLKLLAFSGSKQTASAAARKLQKLCQAIKVQFSQELHFPPDIFKAASRKSNTNF